MYVRKATLDIDPNSENVKGMYVPACSGVSVCTYIYIYRHTHTYAHTHAHLHVHRCVYSSPVPCTASNMVLLFAFSVLQSLLLVYPLQNVFRHSPELLWKIWTLTESLLQKAHCNPSRVLGRRGFRDFGNVRLQGWDLRIWGLRFSLSISDRRASIPKPPPEAQTT